MCDPGATHLCGRQAGLQHHDLQLVQQLSHLKQPCICCEVHHHLQCFTSATNHGEFAQHNIPVVAVLILGNDSTKSLTNQRKEIDRKPMCMVLQLLQGGAIVKKLLTCLLAAQHLCHMSVQQIL